MMEQEPIVEPIYRYEVKIVKEDINLLNLPDEVIINDIILERYKSFFI